MRTKGLLEEVNEPTEWCVLLVLYGKVSGCIRMYEDLQKLNENVQRELHMLPAVQHEMGKLNGARVSFKLDTNSGFWQIHLTKERAKLITFVTPIGRVLFKILPVWITI